MEISDEDWVDYDEKVNSTWIESVTVSDMDIRRLSPLAYLVSRVNGNGLESLRSRTVSAPCTTLVLLPLLKLAKSVIFQRFRHSLFRLTEYICKSQRKVKGPSLTSQLSP